MHNMRSKRPNKKSWRIFLVADTNSISGVVGPPVCQSISLLVCWSRVIKLKSGITSVLDAICVCLCVWDGGWGVDGGWMPLPTRPQRYCDPASLVF